MENSSGLGLGPIRRRKKKKKKLFSSCHKRADVGAGSVSHSKVTEDKVANA